MTASATTVPSGRVPALPRPRIVALYAVLAAASLPPWPFEVHLALHVIGALALIGNAVVMAIWLSIAGFAGGDEAKRRASRAVVLGDALFTVPGVGLLLANGLAMAAERYGGVPGFLRTDFLAVGLVLLVATGAIWALRLVPAQLALHRIAHDTPADAASFRRVLVRWSIWGTAATVLPIAAAFVMTTKPDLF